MSPTARATLLSSLLLHLGMSAAMDGAPLKLPDDDRLSIESSLGRGVVGAEIDAPVIDEPGRYFPLATTAKSFRIVRGPQVGKPQRYRIFQTPLQSDWAGWRYEAGDDEVGYLQRLGDGSLAISGVEDHRTRAVTRYDPPEPLLPKAIAPGERRRIRMAVNVYSAGDLSEVIHRGVLTVDYHYLGACRLVVPAGRFDAIVVKSTFSGRVGPARLEDTQYRFFAAGIGLLASIESRHVSAFWIYQSDEESAKVLERVGP
ncbi:hypothetical protein [Methylococcus sp. EFPC2]|uniref:hypothetical protein n=1 Tax=Methylococcus sp. EFPC2 TaxID=2812648 RepID=UPI001968296D|nr:hypothetical protein [Methylococcus sp. EFPC2]QSA96541.1 hypothetical protein JWZ97_15150 [Methylococcus sp. EFPC2]